MKILAALLFSLLPLALPAQEALPDAEVAVLPELENGAAQARVMTSFDGAVLGVVEGFTEFLPVSSTGHLIIANDFLRLNSDEPAVDCSGKFIERGGKFYTVKDAASAYVIAIQIAAIIAVVFVYWRDVAGMLMGLLGRDRFGLRKLRNLVAAFVPAAVLGLLLHRAIEAYLFSVYAVVFALVAGALAMFWVQKKYGGSFGTVRRAVELHELSLKDSVIVGMFQCLALWPGTSRSMATIIGAYVVGLRPVEAAKFSFLLGLITLSAASAFTIYKDGVSMFAALPLTPMLIGFALAFVCALLSAKWLVGFLNRRGLAPFAWYRIALAAVMCLYFAA